MSAKGRQTEPDLLTYPDDFRINAANREWNHYMYQEIMPVDASGALIEPTGVKHHHHEIVFWCPCKSSSTDDLPKKWMLLGTLQGHRRSRVHKEWLEQHEEGSPKHYMEWKYTPARYPVDKYQASLPDYIHVWDSASLPIKPWTPVKKGSVPGPSNLPAEFNEETGEEEPEIREVDEIPYPLEWTISDFAAAARRPPNAHLEPPTVPPTEDNVSTTSTNTESNQAPAERPSYTRPMPPVGTLSYHNMKTTFNSNRPKT